MRFTKSPRRPRATRRHAPVAAGSLLSLAMLVCVGAATTGCGNTLYLVRVNEAEEEFEEATQLGAEKYAPYEYYSADARLKEAKIQAAHAEYGNASKLSDESAEYARKAAKKASVARASAQLAEGGKAKATGSQK